MLFTKINRFGGGYIFCVNLYKSLIIPARGGRERLYPIRYIFFSLRSLCHCGECCLFLYPFPEK